MSVEDLLQGRHVALDHVFHLVGAGAGQRGEPVESEKDAVPALRQRRRQMLVSCPDGVAGAATLEQCKAVWEASSLVIKVALMPVAHSEGDT